MFGVIDIWGYVVGAALITLLPGPNSMYILSLAGQHGVRAGYRGAGGILLGDSVLMILATAGLATLLHSHKAVFALATNVGSAYLAYVGYTMLSEAWRRWQLSPAGSPPTGEPAVTNPTCEPTGKTSQPFRRALLISLLNPKMMLFFLSFFVQFVDPRYPSPILSFLLLGAVIQLFSALYLTVLILTGASLARQFRRRHRLAAGALSVAGAIFISFGVKLATVSFG
jgi:leucine efflux protein